MIVAGGRGYSFRAAWWLVGAILAAVLGAGLGAACLAIEGHFAAHPTAPPGSFALDGRPAPAFTLVDQFGKSHSLASFRGHEVALAFIDARCTSVCPLTAEIVGRARARLGPEWRRVRLVAVNANPLVTSVRAVKIWSLQHRMLHTWIFLTGSARQLRSIYGAYRIYDRVGGRGQVTHDAAVIIIDADGHQRLYFDTLDDSRHRTVLGEEVAFAEGMKRWLP